MTLYLAVELCVLAIPLALSFDKKVAYYRSWNIIIPSLVITGIFFILIDIYFTSEGVWGFNPDHHSGILFFNLPLEEFLFFIIIPYSSIFIHYVFISYFPQSVLKLNNTRFISLIIITALIIAAFVFSDRQYTLFYALLTATMIIVSLVMNIEILSRYYITFLIIMIPFIIINGILTGSFGAKEVFWYNETEISGIRLLSIPVEDALFSFNLILMNLIAAQRLKKIFAK